jgi:hypothetical protein
VTRTAGNIPARPADAGARAIGDLPPGWTVAFYSSGKPCDLDSDMGELRGPDKLFIDVEWRPPPLKNYSVTLFRDAFENRLRESVCETAAQVVMTIRMFCWTRHFQSTWSPATEHSRRHAFETLAGLTVADVKDPTRHLAGRQPDE